MKQRLVLGIVGSVVVTLALFALPLAWAIARVERDEQRLELERSALAASPELSEGDPSIALAEPPAQPRGMRVAFYAPGGGRTAGVGPARADAAVATALRGANGIVGSVVAVPVSRRDRVVGVVRAEAEPGRLAARIHRAWLLMSLLGIAVLGAVALVAIGLARRLAAPVDALARAAERVGAGDFAVAPEPSGVAEIDSAGLALATAARRLEEVLARERALTADVAHQLRTPLTALRIELEAGAERAQGPSVERALAEVDRIETTIASILALARDTAERAVIDLGAAVRDAVEAWQRPAAARGRELALAGLDGPLPVRASPSAIHQIVDVLVDNALVHGRGPVAVGLRTLPGGAEVAIGDAGPRRLDPTRAFSRRSAEARGHGIGLALARSLAEAEGGRLELDATAPTTTFRLTFPTAADGAPA